MNADHPVRVFLVDDHPMVLAGLAAMIDAEPSLILVGLARDGREALQRIPSCRPDVVLVDLIMPHVDGFELIQTLAPRMPGTHFVVLSGVVDPLTLRRAVQSGARGYLLKTAAAPELVSLIHQVGSGGRVLSTDVTDMLMAGQQFGSPLGDLTSRERQILQLMVQGLGNREIAEAISIALPTVKFHVTNILSKMHVHSRTEAVVLAIRQGLLSDE